MPLSLHDTPEVDAKVLAVLTHMHVRFSDDLPLQGPVKVFLFANGCGNVFPSGIKLVVALLRACDQLRHGIMLVKKENP